MSPGSSPLKAGLLGCGETEARACSFPRAVVMGTSLSGFSGSGRDYARATNVGMRGREWFLCGRAGGTQGTGHANDIRGVNMRGVCGRGGVLEL